MSVLTDVLIKYLPHCWLRSRVYGINISKLKKKGILGLWKCGQMEGVLQSARVKRRQQVINYIFCSFVSLFIFTSAF